MLTIWPPTVWISVPQPTAQYGQTLGTVLASLIRISCAPATAGPRAAPSPARPPTAAPAAALADNRKKSRCAPSMALSPRVAPDRARAGPAGARRGDER